MSIVKLKKITLYGTDDQRETILDGLQSMGCLHLINLASDELPEVRELDIARKARMAINYLQSCPHQRRRSKRTQQFNPVDTTLQVIDIKQKCDHLDDQQDDLQQAIEQVAPWGDFQLPEWSDILGKRFHFLVVKPNQLHLFQAFDDPWTVTSRTAENAYVVLLTAQLPEDFPVSPVTLDPRPLSELREQLEATEEQLEELYWKRVEMTRWTDLLVEDLNHADDLAARQCAQEMSHCDAELFAVQGWAPETTLDELQKFAETHQLALTSLTAGPNDMPPTLLRNPKAIRGAEGAVTFYITPEYHAWDPTGMVYFFFALFFGMIMADAGYALMLGGIVAMFWRRMGATVGGRDLRRFLAFMVSVSFGYGALAGSYFGFGPPEFLAPLKIFDIQDQGLMMALSIVIGVIHLVLANLILAWHRRGSPRCLASVGWAMIIAGGLLLGVGYLAGDDFDAKLARLLNRSMDSTLEFLREAGIILLGIGVAGVVLFTSDRPIFSKRISDHVMRIVEGVMALPGFSKAFGDVLSYLRLFALGLASAQLAGTFNGLAADAYDVQGPGILLAILIMGVGHGINFILAIMSGVVHGLRLNCIEFFNWSLQDEGYAFQAFCKKAGN